MKKIIVAILVCNLVIACSSSKNTVAKNGFIVVPDTTTKVLKGYISRATIENDTTFKWFKENYKYGQADATAVEAFKTNAANFNVLVFGGTWCHDTQNLLPVFYRLVDKSAYPDNKITLVAVDRAKNGPGNLTTKYHITNVPTFIVLKDGKEAGRVVEYGKTGQIDKELGDIVRGTSK